MSRTPALRLLAAAAVASSLFLTSCSGRGKDAGSDAGEEPRQDTVQAVRDTIARPALPREIGADEDPLDYILHSPDYGKYAEGILPQMASEVPKYCRKLLLSKYDRFIVVDKRTMKVLLYDRYGRLEREYKMACARHFGTKHKKGDMRTPEGFFSVEGVYDSTDWVFVDDNGKRSNRKGEFGPRFIRLAIPITWNIGIHGTCAPWSLGGRVSHGCIRISNDDILELVNLVEKGMPVIVSPGIRDRRVNADEGHFVASVTTEPYVEPKIEPTRKENKAEEPDTVPAEIQELKESVPAMPDSI